MAAATQQRWAAAVAHLLQQPEMGPVGKNQEVPDFSWERHIHRLTEDQFKLRYRVTPDSFDRLLRIIEPGLKLKDERQALKSRSGKPIQLQTRLAIALRYFAGGDPHDLFLIYGVSWNTVFKSVWRVVDAISSHPALPTALLQTFYYHELVLRKDLREPVSIFE